ncbi:unnamed protein product, partial [Urochloa humidicola]
SPPSVLFFFFFLEPPLPPPPSRQGQAQQGCRHHSSPGRPRQDLLDATFAADDALDDLESAATVTGDDASAEEALRRAAAAVAWKPHSALRFWRGSAGGCGGGRLQARAAAAAATMEPRLS